MRLFFKQPNKKRLVFTLIIIGLVLAVFLIPQMAAAAAAKTENPVVQGVANIIANVVGFIASIIIGTLGYLCILVARGIIWVASYNGFLQAPAVNLGWTLIRDLCNMFFILILLIIAFSTALGYEKFHYSKTLAPLLVAAVLINFSKLICGLLIDFSQIIMMAFVSSFASAGGANFTNLVGFTNFFQGGALGVAPSSIAWQASVSYVMAVVLTLIFLVVLLAMFAILVVRIVILWFLVVLSPFVFFAQAVPTAQRYASQWWEEFGKQLMVGPVMAIFIWISLSVVARGEMTTGFREAIGVATAGEGPVAFTTVTEPSSFLHYVLGVGMMLGTLMVAQQLGGAGAKIGGKVSKGVTGLYKGTARRFAERTGIAPRARMGRDWALRGLDKMGWTPTGMKMGDMGREARLRRKKGDKAGAVALERRTRDEWRQTYEKRRGIKISDLSDDGKRTLLKKEGVESPGGQVMLESLAEKEKLGVGELTSVIDSYNKISNPQKKEAAGSFLKTLSSRQGGYTKSIVDYALAGTSTEKEDALHKTISENPAKIDDLKKIPLDKIDELKKNPAFNTWLATADDSQLKWLGKNGFQRQAEAIKKAQEEFVSSGTGGMGILKGQDQDFFRDRFRREGRGGLGLSSRSKKTKEYVEAGKGVRVKLNEEEKTDVTNRVKDLKGRVGTNTAVDNQQEIEDIFQIMEKAANDEEKKKIIVLKRIVKKIVQDDPNSGLSQNMLDAVKDRIAGAGRVSSSAQNTLYNSSFSGLSSPISSVLHTKINRSFDKASADSVISEIQKEILKIEGAARAGGYGLSPDVRNKIEDLKKQASNLSKSPSDETQWKELEVKLFQTRDLLAQRPAVDVQ